MYLQVTNGNYVFAVLSEDGFKITEGATPATQTLTLTFCRAEAATGGCSLSLIEPVKTVRAVVAHE